MQKYLILVEGKADAPFVRDYLKFLDKNLSVEKNDPKEKVLKNTESHIKIDAIGGYTNVKNRLKKLQRAVDQNYKILVVLDADNLDKDEKNGGVILRTEYLEKIKQELKIDFEIFLFPNNEDDGNLEMLLLDIANQEKYKPFFECYDGYAICTKKIKIDPSKNLLENKMRIFNYLSVYYGAEQAKEQERIFESEYWELSIDKIEPFKIFLNHIFSKM